VGTTAGVVAYLSLNLTSLSVTGMPLPCLPVPHAGTIPAFPAQVTGGACVGLDRRAIIKRPAAGGLYCSSCLPYTHPVQLSPAARYRILACRVKTAAGRVQNMRVDRLKYLWYSILEKRISRFLYSLKCSSLEIEKGINQEFMISLYQDLHIPRLLEKKIYRYL
jgi:hypothetical protein